MGHGRRRTGVLAGMGVALALAGAAPAGATVVYETLQVTRPSLSHPTLFATVAAPGNRVGDRVVLAPRSGLNALQEWWFAPICYPGCPNVVTGGPGSADLPTVYEIGFKLVNRSSGKCMTINTGTRANGNAVIVDTCGTNVRAQVWKPGLPPWVYPKPDIRPPGPAYESELRDYYSPKGVLAPSLTTMRCLDVSEFKLLAGTPLQIWGCTGKFNQNFIVNPVLRDNRRGAPIFTNP